jgi:16S rRNA (guanine527-N7)-methyltransferase
LSNPIDDLFVLYPDIDSIQIDKLSVYVDLLRNYNKKLNLISRSDIDQVWTNHIFPSLFANILLPFPVGVAVIDLGSGGGLPGIPLKIIRPDLQFVLLDSSHKKSAFLRVAVSKLDLAEIEVFTGRIASSVTDQALVNRFDAVTVRAVASFDHLIEWSRPLLRENGYLLAWKGESDLKELKAYISRNPVKIDLHRIPESYWSVSRKFEQLVFVRLFLNESGKTPV